MYRVVQGMRYYCPVTCTGIHLLLSTRYILLCTNTSWPLVFSAKLFEVFQWCILCGNVRVHNQNLEIYTTLWKIGGSTISSILVHAMFENLCFGMYRYGLVCSGMCTCTYQNNDSHPGGPAFQMYSVYLGHCIGPGDFIDNEICHTLGWFSNVWIYQHTCPMTVIWSQK